MGKIFGIAIVMGLFANAAFAQAPAHKSSHHSHHHHQTHHQHHKHTASH